MGLLVQLRKRQAGYLNSQTTFISWFYYKLYHNKGIYLSLSFSVYEIPTTTTSFKKQLMKTQVNSVTNKLEDAMR